MIIFQISWLLIDDAIYALNFKFFPFYKMKNDAKRWIEFFFNFWIERKSLGHFTNNTILQLFIKS